jgi:hypothetical protein
MKFNFTIDSSIDLVATYAAILSTIIAIWEFLKWKNRNAVSFTCHPSMEFFPSVDGKTYTVVKFINKGQTQTTITHLVLYYWDRWYYRFLKKKWKNFIVREDSVPSTVQPGAIWRGFILQNDSLEKMAENGYLHVAVFHSMSQNDVKQRVRIPTKIKSLS